MTSKEERLQLVSLGKVLMVEQISEITNGVQSKVRLFLTFDYFLYCEIFLRGFLLPPISCKLCVHLHLVMKLFHCSYVELPRLHYESHKVSGHLCKVL